MSNSGIVASSRLQPWWMLLAMISVAFSGCASELEPQSSATPAPTPSPKSTFTTKIDIEPSILHEPGAKAIHLRLVGQSITAVADYPIVDYNRPSVAEAPTESTRFRVIKDGREVTDKLVSDIPTRVGLLTAEPNHIVAIVDTFSGGAHCCFASTIGDPNANDGATIASNDWGNAGYDLIRSADGQSFVFKTADDRAAYTFSSFSSSVFPIQISAYQNGRFVDVTPSYPNAVKRDAAEHWSEFLSDGKMSVAPKPALVAYLADEYRLKNQGFAWIRVRQAYGDDPSFLRVANDWLAQNGYSKSAKDTLRETSPPIAGSEVKSGSNSIATPGTGGVIAPLDLSSSTAINDSREFHGFVCKGSCAGHERGYRWAQARGIDDPHTCYSGLRLSQPRFASFAEGCEAYVDDSTGAARLDASERYIQS